MTTMLLLRDHAEKAEVDTDSDAFTPIDPFTSQPPAMDTAALEADATLLADDDGFPFGAGVVMVFGPGGLLVLAGEPSGCSVCPLNGSACPVRAFF